MNNYIIRKRLIYKSANRGWKETDLLLGEFTKKHIYEMNETQLNMLDLILNEPDADIFSWINKKKPVPDKYENEVMALLQGFKFFNK